MTLTNFNSANMAQAWGNMQAQNNSTCEECHTNGGQGFVASQLVSIQLDDLGIDYIDRRNSLVDAVTLGAKPGVLLWVVIGLLLALDEVHRRLDP